LAGVPRRIGHLHTVGDEKPLTARRRLYLAGARVGLAMTATDIITVSAAVRDAVFARDPWLSRRARVLFDRVDSTRYRPEPIEEGLVVPANGVAILVVGRVGTDKNPRRAVAIAARLTARAAVGPVSIRFAGRVTAEDRQELDDLATALGIGPEVHLLGDRDDVPELMASSTLLLSTSLLEGIPGVVLEAAAAGLPAVVSAIGPSEEAAAHLRGVVPIPLEADDDTWCDVIEDVIAARSDRLTRAAIRANFDRSPFALTCDQAELDALWSAPASSPHDAEGRFRSEQ
jgi:glycosyltransferase involved in cell wall biosynthesis